ncbi:MAG: transcriptional repressor LexA [Anaerolineae bacterium]|nr:transcriptional repressor LexA [Anaerolineae bacterium]
MMKEFDKLSERQRNILYFMDQYMTEHGFPPTIRDIGAATKIDSTSVVNYNLNKLVDAGFLERVASKSRGLRLVKPIPNGKNVMVRSSDTLLRVPHIGTIIAGQPVSVDVDIDPSNAVEVPQTWLNGVDPKDVYALTVHGDSMIDAMIQEGDLVILRKTTTARNGDMVAVWLDERNETTLKYFYDEGNRIRLQPANPTMGPIFVDYRHCQVQGKVLSVMRRLK